MKLIENNAQTRIHADIINCLTEEGDVMVEWLRCSTRIYKILCSNVSIIIHGMTLDKSLTAKLSEMTHSYCTNISSVSTLDRRDADTAVRKKKKMVKTDYMWI